MARLKIHPSIKDGVFLCKITEVEIKIKNAKIILIDNEKNKFFIEAGKIITHHGCVGVEFKIDILNIDYLIHDIVMELATIDKKLISMPLLGNGAESLYIRDNNDYEKRFMLRSKSARQKIGRSDEPLGDFFVAAQVQKNEEICREFRSGASVIMAYKAVELESEVLKGLAYLAIQNNIENNAQCGDDWHPRRNRDHLLASMLCARWHLELCDGSIDSRAILVTFEELWKRSLSFTSYRTAAYPINTSLLLYVFYLVLEDGGEKSQDLIRYIVDVYKKSVSESDIKQLTLFNELAKSHKCAVLAEEMGRSMNKENIGIYVEKVLKVAFRCPDRQDYAAARLLNARIIY